MDERRRYIVADRHPELVTAWQTARIPDHFLELSEITADGFTAAAEEAEQVWVYLAAWQETRRRIETFRTNNFGMR